MTTDEDTALPLSVSQLTIEDADSGTFILTVLPGSNYLVNGTTITPRQDFNGQMTVNVRVSDGVSNSPIFPLQVTVAPINDAPVIAEIPDATAVIGQELEVDVVVIEYFWVTITVDGPQGMEFDDGVITWTPEEAGTFEVVVTATDGQYSVTQLFIITVAKARNSVQLMNVHVTPEEVTSGDVLSVNVVLDNKGNVDLENAKITVIMPELGIKRSSKSFDIDAGTSKRGIVRVALPYDVQPGEYLVKVSVNNDRYHETAYRYVIVTN